MRGMRCHARRGEVECVEKEMQRHSPHSAVSQPIYSNLSSRKTIPGDVRPGNVFYFLGFEGRDSSLTDKE